MANRRFIMSYEANNVVNPRVIWTTLKNFGIDHMIFVNTSGQQLRGQEGITVVPEHHHIWEGHDENGVPYSEYKKVYLKPPESIPGNEKYKGYSKDIYDFQWLKDYTHPEGNVLYLIGPDQYTIPIDSLNMKNADLVAIEIERNSLWSIVAAGIVSRDAYLQDKYEK